jgi:ubiquinone/menaquinone biosynthesis C-methylase UbiE
VKSKKGIMNSSNAQDLVKKCDCATIDGSRFVRAKKIIACLEYVSKDLRNKEALEIGCGSGIISLEISKVVKHMTAVDVTDKVLNKAIESYGISELGFRFIVADGTNLPFPDASFDIVVCNQVIEHVGDQDKLIAEVYRVLRSDGICYMATPNRLWPIEPHTSLPFLSYLPKSIANRYVRRFRGIDKYDVNLLTYWKFKQALLGKFDKLIDITPVVIKNSQQFYTQKSVNLTPVIVKNSQQFYAGNEIPGYLGNLLKKVPIQFLRMLIPFSPGWIFIGVKSRPENESSYTTPH